MTLRQYLVLMIAGTALAWGAVALVVTTVDPSRSTAMVFGVFFAALFLALAGLIALVAFALRIALLREQLVVSRHVAVSFRQAILLSFIFCLALFLRFKGLLNWWNISLIVIAVTLLESFFITAAAQQQGRRE